MQPSPKHYPETGEWYYRGEWYDDFPADAIRAHEEYLEGHAEYILEMRREARHAANI